MSEWKPIETAPKGGTLLDLWVGGRRYPDCRWQEGWDLNCGGRVPPGWWFFEADGEYSTRFPDPTAPESQNAYKSNSAHREPGLQPTHWMLPPAAPTSTRTD